MSGPPTPPAAVRSVPVSSTTSHQEIEVILLLLGFRCVSATGQFVYIRDLQSDTPFNMRVEVRMTAENRVAAENQPKTLRISYDLDNPTARGWEMFNQAYSVERGMAFIAEFCAQHPLTPGG